MGQKREHVEGAEVGKGTVVHIIGAIEEVITRVILVELIPEFE